MTRPVPRADTDVGDADFPGLGGHGGGAWRKYHTYGTILVDLDRHKVVDLLPDRSAESVAAWLTLHPTVDIVARDRSGLYADGAATGAPHAQQVADRFHLILNLSTAIEGVLEQHSRELILPAEAELPALEPATPFPPGDRVTAPQLLQQQRRQRRLERYESVMDLHRRGFSQLAISRGQEHSRRGWAPSFAVKACTPRTW